MALTQAFQYTAAAKTSALDAVGKAMENILSVFKKDPKLQEIIRAPMLSESDKKQIAQEIMKQSGAPDKDNVVKNFLNTLAENNRLGILEQVCEKFGTLMGAYRGEAELVVTSAAVCRHPRSKFSSLQRIKSLTQAIAT